MMQRVSPPRLCCAVPQRNAALRMNVLSRRGGWSGDCLYDATHACAQVVLLGGAGIKRFSRRAGWRGDTTGSRAAHEEMRSPHRMSLRHDERRCGAWGGGGDEVVLRGHTTGRSNQTA